MTRWYLTGPGQCCDQACVVNEDGIGLHHLDEPYAELDWFVGLINQEDDELDEPIPYILANPERVSNGCMIYRVNS